MNRRMRVLSLLIAGTAVLAACAAPPPRPASTIAAPVAPAAESALMTGEKDQIILAIGGESEDGYDPTLGWGRYGSPLFQSTLLRRDANLNIVNDLAESHSVSSDGLTYKITIRKDAKFSDGSALTAKDVAYTFNKAQESAGKTDVTVLDKATATSDYDVELKLKQPQSTFINRLVTLGIVPQKLHSANAADYAKNPIGSGPYKLVKWETGKQLIVERNDLYYGNKPAIKRLVFLFNDQEANGGYTMAKANEVQVAFVPPALAKESIPGFKLYAVKSVDNRGLLFPYVPNEGKKTADGNPIGNNVTSDLAIRQAANFVLNRQAMVEGVLEGYGSPAYGPVSGLPWEQTDAAIQDGNADMAKKILADAGWKAGADGTLEKNGTKAEFTIVYPSSDSTRQALALTASDMIKPLGIKIEVVGKSWDDIAKLKHSNVIVFGWGSHDATEVYNLYHSSYAGQGWYNTGYYANKQIDSQLDLAMGAPSQDEANVFWKNAQWDGKAGFTAKGDAAWAWMVNLYHTYQVNECLNIGAPQIEPHGHGWPITASIAEWKWTCK